MTTTSQIRTWIRKHGIKAARELCLAYFVLYISDDDAGTLREILADLYQEGFRGTGDYSRDECVTTISDAMKSQEASTVEELVEMLSDFHAIGGAQ